MSEDKEVYEQIIALYSDMIQKDHPRYLSTWPILSGYDCMLSSYGDWRIVIYKHTGNPIVKNITTLAPVSSVVLGAETIDGQNRDAIRGRVERHFRVKADDGVVLVPPDGAIGRELLMLKAKHELAMDLTPRKIFLSHRGVDKPLVRDFYRTLQLLGLEPWLDDDAMVAGVELERGLLQGFKDSCAAVFFVTPRFVDEKYLATEVNYAIAEKRKKGDRFAIVTLAFTENGKKGTVPELLRTYIYKEPATHLEALREIIRALPLAIGDIRWKA